MKNSISLDDNPTDGLTLSVVDYHGNEYLIYPLDEEDVLDNIKRELSNKQFSNYKWKLGDDDLPDDDAYCGAGWCKEVVDARVSIHTNYCKIGETSWFCNHYDYQTIVEANLIDKAIMLITDWCDEVSNPQDNDDLNNIIGSVTYG